MIQEYKDSIKVTAHAIHASTNHIYGKKHPYGFHLDMVHSCYTLFSHELKKDEFYDNWGRHQSDTRKPVMTLDEYVDMVITEGIYFHDTIEDCRVTYHDLLDKYKLDVLSAEIVYAVTDDKGRNRAERGNLTLYLNMREIPGATFVKMCDRLANMSFSKKEGSTMFEKYKSELPLFLGRVDADKYPELKKALLDL